MACSILGWTALALFALAAGIVRGADVPERQRICSGLFGTNILKTGTMDKWDKGAPVGWSVKGRCFADDQTITGKGHCARLEVPKKGRAVLTSDLIPVSPGAYFVRYVFRQDVPKAREGAYARESFMTVECLAADGKALRSAYAFGSELPIRNWLYRQRLVVAPAGTKALRINLFFVNHVGEDKPCALWVDDVAVSPYYSPQVRQATVSTQFMQELGRSMLTVEHGGPGYRVFEGGIQYGETSSVYAVPDPMSASGIARHWPAYKKGTFFWHSAPCRGIPPGVYRLTLRVRAGAEDTKDRERPVIQVGASYPHINSIGLHQFFASDLKRDGKYHDLSFDFVKPDWGGMSLRIDTLREAPEFWLDYVLVRPIYHLTDADSQALYPAPFTERLPPPDFPHRHKPRVLLIEGLSAGYFRLDDALRLAEVTDMERISYKITYREGPVLDGMPETWEDFYRRDIFILANIGMGALSAEQRYRLREWLRNGGGLIILGGKAAYGGSGLKGSFLDDVLPVEVSENRFDIAKNAARLSAREHAITNGLDWNQNIVSPYIHELTVRPGAQEVISSGKRPFLVLGSFGKGRVACVCAPPYGTARRGEVAFWAWEEWPALVRNLLDWTSSRRNAVGSDRPRE